MSARFYAVGDVVLDRKMTYAGHPTQVATADDGRWAQMIADGLNWVIDQVTPWDPSAAHSPVVDGEVIDATVDVTLAIES